MPTISPGRLFTRFTTDQTLNIRWLTASDPAFAEVLNRPVVDEALRTLILSKAVDTLYGSLGHQALYPFLVQPRIASGTVVTDVPLNWIWDLTIALPKKWERLRLAKIKRIAGTNSDTSGYNGFLRLIFTAQLSNSSSETSLLWVDYQIDSALTYQLTRLQVCNSSEESNALPADEAQTVAGTITFRTLDPTEIVNAAFLELVEPPAGLVDANYDGYYDNPAVYELVDTTAGGTSSADDYSSASVGHGTGLLTDSAYTTLPALDSNAQSWLDSFNYPFDQAANRTSTSGIQIPLGLFREFNLTVPAGDEPTGTSSGLYFPVWVNRIELVSLNRLRWYFATHNTTESETGGSPSTVAIEFASMDLVRTMQAGELVPITPLNNLKMAGVDAELYGQHLGRGHVVLSGAWEAGTAVTDFFAAFTAILDNPQDTDFSQGSTRIGSFGLSRVPKYTPTVGQSRALLGSTSRLEAPIPPSQDNRYVTEQDQGLGNVVDLEVGTITPVTGIERYGNSGSLCHRIVRLIVLADQVDSSSSTFYDQHILPRLRLLLGRDPIFGDIWYNGTRFVSYNGDTWQD